LHCPSDDGVVWQWHPVTKTFEEFLSYCTKDGFSARVVNPMFIDEALREIEGWRRAGLSGASWGSLAVVRRIP
jgi:hypothetical protein